jgi:proton-translocating NAD(P)+ transhydrogenase subunit alpha
MSGSSRLEVWPIPPYRARVLGDTASSDDASELALTNDVERFMKVAVLGESQPGEHRVAIIPSSIRELEKAGIDVAVVQGAGKASHYLDAEYAEAGAAVVADASAALEGATIALKVQPPTADEIGQLPKGIILISLLSPLSNAGLIQRLAAQGVTSFALELIPRITRAQRMDVLSSQATVAGYKAVLLGANALGKFLPMFMTAAGTIRPGKVLVLGAGVAGLQAIATARRLGAKVEAFDVRPAVKEQVESLGATFIEAEEEVTAEGEGGYAKELSDDQHQKELALIAAHVHDTDIVITTAQIPGRPAPELITREMVESMRPGSVIVDLAAPSGGNCSLSEDGKTVEHSGVFIIGPSNLPAEIPVHASQMFAKNVVTFLKEMIDSESKEEKPSIKLDFDDEIINATCVAHAGEVRSR